MKMIMIDLKVKIFYEEYCVTIVNKNDRVRVLKVKGFKELIKRIKIQV